MRIVLAIKIIAGLATACVVAFTAMLSYHIAVAPLDGIFETIIPEAGAVIKVEKEEDFAKALEAAEMVDYEPGDRAFQKAHELIALGQIKEGREKMTSIVNVFPTSPAAPTARRIVGQMNLDEILSRSFKKGKTEYTVQRGDSYYGIIGKNDTTLDMVIHLNGLMELDVTGLQPGDKYLLMPLNFRLLIEPHRKALSVWEEGKFICEYPIVKMDGVNLSPGKTEISGRRANLNGSSISPIAENYRGSSKIIQLANPTVQIYPYDKNDEEPPIGIYLKPVDMEELFLLTRTGNEVEIRAPRGS